MCSQDIAIGTASASAIPVSSQTINPPVAVPSTLKDLIDIVRTRGEKNVPMLRTTAVRLSEFVDRPLDQLSIEELVDVRDRFRAYLQSRRYSNNSVRTYCQNAQRLLRWAEEVGWTSSKQSVEELWTPYLEALKGDSRAYKRVIRFAI